MKKNFTAPSPNDNKFTWLPAIPETFYPANSASSSKPSGLQYIFNFLNPRNSSYKPANHAATGSPVYPVKKINDDYVEFTPSLKDFLKQTALRLSDIEMAIYNYDPFRLRIASVVLKNLFLDMKAPSAFRLMVQLEELARENDYRQANDRLLLIKEFIAKVARYSGQIKY